MGPVLNPCPPDVHFPIDSSVRHIVDHLSWSRSCERLAAVHDGLGSGDVRA